LHFAEEYIRPVLAAQFLGAIRVLIHPLPDALHRHLILRDDVALNQDTADGRIRKSIIGVVVDADGRAILKPDTRRALDLRKEQIGLALEPADFKAPPRNRTVLDFSTIIIWHQFPATDLAKHRPAVRQRERALLVAPDKEIRWAPINRYVVNVRLRARSIDDRLVIAGDEAV